VVCVGYSEIYELSLLYKQLTLKETPLPKFGCLDIAVWIFFRGGRWHEMLVFKLSI